MQPVYHRCMNCLLLTATNPCEICGMERPKNDLSQLKSGGHVLVWTDSQGEYAVEVGGALSRFGTSHGYNYKGWENYKENKPVWLKECAIVSENGRDHAMGAVGDWYDQQLARITEMAVQLWNRRSQLELPTFPVLYGWGKGFGDSEYDNLSYRTTYAIQEWVEGIPLSEFLKNLGGRMNALSTLRFLKPLMQDLAKAHEAAIFHGNITTGAIVITFQNRARFRDFGAAWNIGDYDIPIPMPDSPYARVGDSRRDDIYRMAAVIYECLTGTAVSWPKPGSPAALDWGGCDPAFSQSMRTCIERALSPDASVQYPSMDDFGWELFRGL